MNNKKNKLIIKKSTRAFTLIEALVAISILMIAIASPMTLAQKGLATATLTKDQMTAAFLAQDAIEAVKNIRDQVALRGNDTDWLDNDTNSSLLHACMCTSNINCNFNSSIFKSCIIDTTSLNWDSNSIQSAGSPYPVLQVHYSMDISGVKQTFLKYGYSLNCGLKDFCEDSRFTRYINIRKDPSGTNPDEALVQVRVSWDSPQGPQKIDIKNFIYNYSENF